MINLSHLFITAWKSQVTTVVASYITVAGTVVHIVQHLPHVPGA